MSGARQRAGAEKEGSPRQRGREGNEAASKGSPEVSTTGGSLGRGWLVWLVGSCAVLRLGGMASGTLVRILAFFLAMRFRVGSWRPADVSDGHRTDGQKTAVEC